MLAAAVGCAPSAPQTAISSARAPSEQPTSELTEAEARAADSERATLQRFVSVNIPNLHYIEDDWRFDSTMRYRLPNEFEIRDALEAVRQMGARVVRIYTLSVRKPADLPSVPRHVTGPGEFNEEAFQALDLVLALAREYGIQVIVPFVDNWQWWGGVAEYAAFRGLERDAFWSDEQLFADFRQTLEFVITRKNTINGVVYRDDPSVYAWETGNELQAPWAWTERAAHAIRQLDSEHAIIDGVHSRFVRDEALDSPLIDVLTTHHYTDGAQMVADVRANASRIAGAKPYFVGEFGFIPPHEVAHALDTVIEEQALGALIWSLRFRNREGGFYTHAEKPGFESYHWPGFASGADYHEAEVMSVLQERAHRIAGVSPRAIEAPAPPTLLPHSQPLELYWQGSAGADSYMIERSARADGPWQLVTSEVSDAHQAYRPQYADNGVPLDSGVYYRVIAQNTAGLSPPSNTVGPVATRTRRLVDEFVHLKHLQSSKGAIELVSHKPMTFKMDKSRLRSSAAAQLTYEPGGELRALQLDVFLTQGGKPPSLSGSSDGRSWQPITAEMREFVGEADTPEWPRPVRMRATAATGTKQLRVQLARGVELARLDLDFVPSE